MFQRLGPIDACELIEMMCSTATETESLFFRSMLGSAWILGRRAAKPTLERQSKADEAKGGWAGSRSQQGVVGQCVPPSLSTAGLGLCSVSPPPPVPSSLASSCKAASISLPDVLTHLDRTQAELRLCRPSQARRNV